MTAPESTPELSNKPDWADERALEWLRFVRAPEAGYAESLASLLREVREGGLREHRLTLNQEILQIEARVRALRRLGVG